VLNHRSFFDFMAVSNERFGFNGSEIIGSLSPIVFDIFDFELCMLMVNGSQLVLLDAFLAAFPVRLLEMMANNHVNFIFWVPSIMVTIANMGLLDKVALPDLKLVWFAGEVFPTKQFLVWYDKLTHTKFANLYGPIEITLDCTYYAVEKRPDEKEPLPIGIPYRNTDILLLNDDNQECKIGEEGELCVRGTSLAMGYYNNPEKTAAAFTQNPLNTSYPEIIYRTGDIAYMREDGNIIFNGRKDSLIKHMGYRIELGEIEHVICNDLKLVKYCCAVYQYAKKEIVLYYENGNVLTGKEFRSALSKVFPAYMIPSVFIKLEALPRNTNGKIDRLLLKNKANE
jgi:non-ribosomal peptide synthetase component F